MPNSTSHRIGIVGTGRLGSQLAYWLARTGTPAAAIFSRDSSNVMRAIRLSALGSAHAGDVGGAKNPVSSTKAPGELGALLEACDVVLLAVPDGTLAMVAAELAKHPMSGKVVAHCCGAIPAAVLEPVKLAGGEIACFHPIQSFPPLDADAVAEHAPSRSHFAGIAVGIEASDAAYPELTHIAAKLGCTPLRLSGDPRQRVLYHASAVVAGNAMTGLLDFAIDLMEMAGVEREDGRFALLPLMGGTLANLVTHSPGEALTGPISRGDGATVAAHLDALASDPALQALYSNLSARLLLLAVKSGRITGPQATAISEVLLTRLLRGSSHPRPVD